MICNVEWQHIEGNYPVITLCESTRFKEEFMMAQKRLTLEGHIVISVGLFGHSGDEEVWDGMDEGTLSKTKEMLDDTGVHQVHSSWKDWMNDPTTSGINVSYS